LEYLVVSGLDSMVFAIGFRVWGLGCGVWVVPLAARGALVLPLRQLPRHRTAFRGVYINI